MLPTDPNHFGQGDDQERRHFVAVEVSRSEIELPHAVGNHGLLLQVVEANTLVFREQYPAFFSDKRQPYRVFRSGGEMLAVAPVMNAALRECLQNWFAVVKILVQIKNEVFRRRWRPSSAPNGLPLRSVWGRRHIRKRDQEPIRGR